MRSRSVGGTNRPGAVVGSGGSGGSSTRGGSGAAAGSGTAGGGGSATTVAAGATGSAATGGAATGGSSIRCSATAGTDSGASTGAGAGVGAGAGGLIVLTRRGGPSTGAVGLGGSAFFVAAVFFPPLAGAGTSANISPLGSAMLRCRATRSTKDRATTSSMVLDALFSSMPWSRFKSASTSWLVEPSNSATL
jgi:hypothetical protein